MPVDLEIIDGESLLTSGNELSSAIRKLRRKKGITQRELAEKLGISQKTYSSLERNACKAGFSRVMQLLNLLEADLAIRQRDENSL